MPIVFDQDGLKAKLQSADFSGILLTMKP